MKINQLTFTRFLAALAVVIFHYGRELFFFTNDTVSFIFKHGDLGVTYFFILSGFIMMVVYNYKDKVDTLNYYKNRFARIFPVYVFATLAFCLVGSFFDLKLLLLNLFALQAWTPGLVYALNAPGWTISVECFFYLLFPFLCNYFYRRNNNRVIFSVLIAFWLLSLAFVYWYMRQNIVPFNPEFMFTHPLMNLNLFLMGNMAGIIFLEKIKPAKYDMPILIITLLFIVSLKIDNIGFYRGVMALFFLPFIILLSANTGFITKAFSAKPLVYLGDISYSLYILHGPVHTFLVRFLKLLSIEMNTLSFFGLYILLLLLVAAACYEIIEKPARKYIRNLSFGRVRSL